MTLMFILAPALTTMALITQQSHLLMTLLTLESLTLSLVLSVPMFLIHSSMNLNILSIVLLSFGACEASLGLSLLVMMSRSSGTDLIHNLSMNKC